MSNKKQIIKRFDERLPVEKILMSDEEFNSLAWQCNITAAIPAWRVTKVKELTRDILENNNQGWPIQEK